MAGDVSTGRPIVAHVVVALCDNKHQGIVPVPAFLGNGQDPASNLYWGAGGGVKTFLKKKAGWEQVEAKRENPPGVLETIVLRQKFSVLGSTRTVYLVAEAWDGRLIGQAIERFLTRAGGGGVETWSVGKGEEKISFEAGGAAQLAVFVGHDGLMDAPLEMKPVKNPLAKPRGAVVLACASEPFFGDPIQETGAFPLVVTSGLMAPEAYTLDVIVKSVAQGRPPHDVREAAAQAYNRYQKCGIKAARRLFNVQ